MLALLTATTLLTSISSSVFNKSFEVSVSASKHHPKKHKHVTKLKNKVDATHKYFVDDNTGSYPIIDDDDFNTLQNPDESVSFGSMQGMSGDFVHIIDQKEVAGYQFYKIKDMTSTDADNGWVYEGYLSNKANGKSTAVDYNSIRDKVSNEAQQAQVQSKANSFNNNDQALQSGRQQVLNNVNNDRASVGLSPLQEDAKYDQLAQLRAEQSVQNFSHFDASGQAYFETEAPQFGISTDAWAENLAQASGDNSADAANYANGEWWDDEKGATPDQDGGHRKNIRSSNATVIGIGIVYDQNSDTWYLAQDFD